MSNKSREPLTRRAASQSHLVKVKQPPVIPGRARSSSDDMYRRLISRYISPEEKWILWENADKVPGDSMVVRCNGCLCPLRTGLYEETPRSGCALTDRELEEFRSKPSSKRPPWQAVTNCDGASTREVYREMSVEQAKSGMEEPFVYAPFSEAELSVEAWKLAHQLACDFVEATQAYSKLWRKDDDTV